MITLLNLIRIVYSIYKTKKFDKCLSSQIIEDVVETHNTSSLSIYEMCVWINYLKAIGQCENWSKAQMLREMIYHKKLYWLGYEPTRTIYTDFEKKQTLKTYIRRILGNCII